jgi:hypothetical protein
MRWSILSLLVLALASGCGGDSGNNGNGGSGGTGGGGGSGGSGGGGGNGGGSDMGVGGSCSVLKQDCTGGQKCIPLIQGANATVVGTTCVPNGTVAEGMACVQVSNNTQLNDNCVAGTVCDNTGNDSTLHCRKYCDATTKCGTGSACAAVYTSNWGLCVPSCTPFGTDCPTGNDCSTTFDAVSATTNSGVFVCKTTGMGKAGAMCMGDTDCGPSLQCVGPVCTPICDSAHQCPMTMTADGGTLSCQSYVNTPNMAGVCG